MKCTRFVSGSWFHQNCLVLLKPVEEASSLSMIRWYNLIQSYTPPPPPSHITSTLHHHISPPLSTITYHLTIHHHISPPLSTITYHLHPPPSHITSTLHHHISPPLSTITYHLPSIFVLVSPTSCTRAESRGCHEEHSALGEARKLAANSGAPQKWERDEPHKLRQSNTLNHPEIQKTENKTKSQSQDIEQDVT